MTGRLGFCLALLGGVLWAAEPDREPGILWRAPASLGQDHWICGPGGCQSRPAPPFQFVRDETEGSSPKVQVRDANGRTWSVKFGGEAIPECFASRFVSALGYTAEKSYCINGGKIENLGAVRKPVEHSFREDGTFTNARFEMRDDPAMSFLSGHTWAWNANPFTGTRELAGLKIAMMLLSNWDAKDARDTGESNNAAFRMAGSGEVRYMVFDWGASLGRWGGSWRRTRSDCSGFAQDTRRLVKGVRQGHVEWGFSGKHEEDLASGITPEDVRWLLPYLQRIGPDDLQTGLTASGATPRQARCWATAIQNRVRELEAVAKP